MTCRGVTMSAEGSDCGEVCSLSLRAGGWADCGGDWKSLQKGKRNEERY